MEMQMEQNPPIIAKKLWNVVRIVLLMLRKSISKSKLMLDLHVMLKRGKLAGKAALRGLHHHHYSAAAAGNRDYEFSCSNSPASHSFPYKRGGLFRRRPGPEAKDTAATVVQKVLEMLNNDEQRAEVVAAASPLVLPGFGRSPAAGKQLRISDSPFPARESEDDRKAAANLNKAAEEFIDRFYRDLKQQRSMAAAIQSPYPDLWN